MLNHPKFKAHHIGCLTEDITQSLLHYKSLGFESISEIYPIAAQKVNVCFVEIQSNFYLELVEFHPENAALKRIFKNSNPYYHVGYLTENVPTAIKMLENEGFRLVNQFNSEAFKNKLCAFLYSPEMHLIELIEA